MAEPRGAPPLKQTSGRWLSQRPGLGMRSKSTDSRGCVSLLRLIQGDVVEGIWDVGTEQINMAANRSYAMEVEQVFRQIRDLG